MNFKAFPYSDCIFLRAAISSLCPIITLSNSSFFVKHSYRALRSDLTLYFDCNLWYSFYSYWIFSCCYFTSKFLCLTIPYRDSSLVALSRLVKEVVSLLVKFCCMSICWSSNWITNWDFCSNFYLFSSRSLPNSSYISSFYFWNSYSCMTRAVFIWFSFSVIFRCWSRSWSFSDLSDWHSSFRSPSFYCFIV